MFKQGNFLSGPWAVAGNSKCHRKGEGALSRQPVEVVPGLRTIKTMFIKVSSEVSGFQFAWQVIVAAAEDHSFALLATPSPSLLGALAKDALPLIKGDDPPCSEKGRKVHLHPVHQSHPALQSRPAHQPHQKSSDLCLEVAFARDV